MEVFPKVRHVGVDRYTETVVLATSHHREIWATDNLSLPEVNLRWKPRSAGDCINLASLTSNKGNQNSILWSYQADFPQSMSFTRIEYPGSVLGSIEVKFPRRVYPAAVLAVHAKSVFAYVLDERGLVWTLKVTDLEALKNPTGAEEGPVVEAVGKPGFGEKVASLKEVVFLGRCGQCLCACGKNGVALAMELGALHGDDEVGNRPVELWEGYFWRVVTTVLRGGMLGPALVSAAVIDCELGTGGEAVALIYEDKSIRVHDVVKNELLVVHKLELEGGLVPVGAAYCSSGMCLVVQFAGTRSGIVTLGLEIKRRKLVLSSGVPTYRRISEHAQITSAVHWKGCMWVCLSDVHHKSELVPIGEEQSVTWIDQHPHILGDRPVFQLHHQGTLWQQSIEEATKTKHEVLHLGEYSFQKLLDFGPLSYGALKDTLEEVSVEFTMEDWRDTGSGRIAAMLEGAAHEYQSRNPGYTPIMCHWCLVQAYYEHWTYQHKHINLVLSPDCSVFFLVRAGSILSVVREMTAVESLIKDVKALLENRTNVISDPLHCLIQAFLQIQQVCGSLFLDSCSMAVLKGVDALQAVIPAAVQAILSPTIKDRGRPLQEVWNSERRSLQADLNSILKKVIPNLEEAIEALCKVECPCPADEEMNINETTATGISGYAANVLQQVSFAQQQLLSGVIVVLGIGQDTLKEALLEIFQQTRSLQKIHKSWIRSIILHSLCNTPSKATGIAVKTQALTGTWSLTRRAAPRFEKGAFVSIGHVLAQELLGDENKTMGLSQATLSSTMNAVGKEFCRFLSGEVEDHEGLGFTLRLCELASALFLKGQLQAVSFLGQVSVLYDGGLGHQIMQSLAKAVKIGSMKSKESTQEAEEEMAELVGCCAEQLKRESDKYSGFYDVIHTLHSSFISGDGMIENLSTQLIYFEMMVFALDHLKAHRAASQVARMAIDTIANLPATEDLQILKRHLWEQVFHYSCVSCNFALAFTALCENPDATNGGGSFSLRELVVSMCKAHHIDELLSLPFGALRGSVVGVLKDLTDSATIHEQPSPHEILYRWYYQSADYQSAAEVLVAHARHIEQEALNRPGAVGVLYSVSVRAALVLGLCEQQCAWVAVPRKKGREHLPPVIGLEELKRENAKLRAFLKILDLREESSEDGCGVTCDHIPSLDHVFQELLSFGCFEYVLRNIPHLFEERDQYLALKKAFSVIAVECVKKTNGSHVGGDGPDPNYHPLFQDLKAWLQDYGRQDGCCLKIKVAEMILETDSKMLPPQWLIEMCRERRRNGSADLFVKVSPLIAVLHRYGHVDLAVELLLDEAHYATHQLHMDSGVHEPQLYIPVHLVTALRNSLLERENKGLVEELDYTFQNMFNLQNRWTSSGWQLGRI